MLLWAAEASAGSRISLLPFEGDRPRPVRWRVAYALKRAGHVVLGTAPPTDRSSVGALRDYADQRNVDLFISGRSIESADGWDLSLRFRGADGKAVGQPLKFHADNLRGMLIELKSEGPSKLDRAVRGGAPSAVAELPPGRALPLPTRRTARSKPRSDRPVLPGAAPAAEPAAEAPARTAPAEVDLDAAVAAAAARPDTWDADGDEPPARPAPRPRRGAKQEPAAARATMRKNAAQRLATGGMFSSGAPAGRRRGGVELDAATRSALEEGPKSKARPVLDEPAAEAASDPLADPAAPPETVAAAAEPESTTFDADAMDQSAEEPVSEPEAKPRKKGGLFAGRLRRKSPSSDSSSATPSEASEESAGNATVEDRDTSGGEPGARPAPPLAVLGAQAGFLRRSLAYSDDLYNRLRAPTTNGWVYRLDAAFYPFAKPLKEQVALIASYEGALGGTVRDSRNNRDFGVKFSNIEAGARVRQALGEHELGVQATVGQLKSGLDASSSLTDIPEISYMLLSPSVDLTLNFGAVSLHSALGYQRSVGGFGEVANAQWFPHMEGYGVSGQLGLDYRFSPSVALRGGGVLRRFVLDMNSRPEDATLGQAEVAGGAVDQYLSGYFGVAFTL
ncbi:MAG: hypothetical protein ABI895_18205 [Deltaproteobacteria bacterium]